MSPTQSVYGFIALGLLVWAILAVEEKLTLWWARRRARRDILKRWGIR